MKAKPEITMSEVKKLGKPEGVSVYPLLIAYCATDRPRSIRPLR